MRSLVPILNSLEKDCDFLRLGHEFTQAQLTLVQSRLPEPGVSEGCPKGHCELGETAREVNKMSHSFLFDCLCSLNIFRFVKFNSLISMFCESKDHV